MRATRFKATLGYILALLSMLIVCTTLWPQYAINDYFIEALVIYGLIAVLCFIKNYIAFILGCSVNIYYLFAYHSMGVGLSQIATLPAQPVVVLLSLVFSVIVSILGLALLFYLLIKKH